MNCRKFIILCLVSVGMGVWFAPLMAQEKASSPADIHFNKGQEFYASNKCDDAIRELNAAINLDKNYAPAYNLLAIIHLAKGSTQDIMAAEQFAHKAVLLDSNNVDYKVTLANVYIGAGKHETAQKNQENANVSDKLDKDDLYIVGKSCVQNAVFLNNLVNAQDVSLYDDNYLREIQEYGSGNISAFRASRAKDADQPIIYFDKYFKREFKKGEDTFAKLEAVEPHYKDSDSLRAVLDYQIKDWNSMIKHLQDYMQSHPENKYAFLLSGLAYLRSGDYAKAQDSFSEFKKRASVDESSYFEQFDLFLSKKQQDSIRAMTKEQQEQYHNNFWSSRDSSPLNLRKLEHYGRMAEAYMLFSIPKENIPGWKTDRGIIWVRYGAPKLRINNLKLRTFGETLGMSLNETTDEWWYYDKFTLEFYEFPYKSGNYQFYDTRDLFFSEIARQIQVKQPDEFSVSSKHKM